MIRDSKRILLIGTLPPELGSKNFGGVARSVWSIAKEYKTLGLDFCVLGLGHYYKKFQIVNGIKVYGPRFSIISLIVVVIKALTHFKFFWELTYRDKLRLAYAIYYLNFISRCLKYDVIHLHHAVNQFSLAKQILNIDTKIVLTIHSYTSILNINNSIKQRARVDQLNQQFKGVNYVTHVSNSVRNQGKSLGVFWSSNDVVIYNGIDLIYDGYSSISCGNSVAFVGRVSRMKGIFHLMSSTRYLSQNDFRIKVIGTGPDLAQVMLVCKSLKYSVDFLGHLDNKRVMRELSLSGIMVLPSQSESFGLVYLESLVAGTPIIGYAPIINELKDKLSVHASLAKWFGEYNWELDTPYDLAKKIEVGLKIKLSPSYPEERQLVRELVEKHFSWSKIASQYVNILDSVI